MGTSIQWTDETWNPTTGCTRVSEGCRNCYIERTPAFRINKRKFVNGSTGVLLHPDRLDKPMHWKKPRRVFVNSLSDLFHESIPLAFIFQVLTVIWQAKHHTFQVLTKRPLRMRLAMEAHYCSIQRGPLENLWLGVSVEDQATADERIPILLETPAAVRFISAEPLLGPIDIRAYSYYGSKVGDNVGIQWAIVGGESGPGARGCDVDWIYDIKEWCQGCDVPVFIKQLGARPYTEGTIRCNLSLKDKKGGDMAEWPEDLRVRQYPTPCGGEHGRCADVGRRATIGSCFIIR